MKLLLFLVWFPIAALPACVPVNGERVRAGDLAQAEPVFAAVAPDKEIAFAPAPGARRIFSIRELSALAAELHVPLPTLATDICVQSVGQVLQMSELDTALRKALDIPDAVIEILDFSKAPVPVGALEFSRTGLSSPASPASGAAVLWHGRLRYWGTRTLPVWVKVRLTVKRPVVVARVDIVPGHEIRPDQIEVVETALYALAEGSAQSVEEVAGKLTRHLIRTAQPVALNTLEQPLDVVRGDTVDVLLRNGLAVLKFPAQADSNGRKGDRIVLHNAGNGHRFQGVIDSNHSVTIDITGVKQHDAPL